MTGEQGPAGGVRAGLNGKAPARILNVDDNEAGRYVTTYLLRDAGFEVTEAVNGREALEKARALPDLVLLDVNLPDIHGFEVCRRIKEDPATAHIPVLHISATLMDDDAKVTGLLGGADGYLTQPVDPRVLISTIRALLRVRSAEADLRQSEQRFRTFFDLDPNYCYMISPDGRILDLNRAALGVLGYASKEEVVGKPLITTVYAPRSQEKAMRILDQWKATGKVRNEEMVVRTKSGNERTVLLNVSAVYGTDGSLVHSISSQTDITMRKRAEEALLQHQHELAMQNEELARTRRAAEELAAKYLDLYESVPAGYLTIDPAGTILSINLTGASILGKKRELVTGSRLSSFIRLEYIPSFREFRERVMATDTTAEFDVELAVPPGDPPRYAHIEGTAAPENGSGVRQIRLLLTDITRTKEAEMKVALSSAIAVANRKLNLLASVTRHDILNQLTVLLSYLDLSRGVTDNPAVLSGYMEKALKVAATIEQQIRFTRDYQDLGVQAPAWQGIGTSVQEVMHLTSDRDVDVRNTCQEVVIYADPLFSKVFFNLFDNSLRHGGEGLARISLSCRETGDGLLVLYEDDGTGIPAADKERVFERGVGKNAGFGLFLAREILSITGISISETGVPGKGARFEIVVPKGEYRVTVVAGTGNGRSGSA